GRSFAFRLWRDCSCGAAPCRLTSRSAALSASPSEAAMSRAEAYIICGTPRSGSTLLCGLLEDAGCGVPDSYFRRQSIAGIADELGVIHDGDLHSPDFSRRYLDAII